MDLRYRALPRCYGHYRLNGEEIVVAEIEEVCVGNKTLSFEDYLECRHMHLIVTIFYNDSLFLSLLKLIKGLGLSPWRWIEHLCEVTPPDALGELFASFRDATTGELWEDEEALHKFIDEPGIIEKFVDGEIGNNLLFVHKTRAITQCANALATLAKDATIRLLEESGVTSPELDAFVEEAARFHELRMSNLFTNLEDTPAATFGYDVQAYLDDPKPVEVHDYQFDAPTDVDFVLDSGQRDVIERFLGIYGCSDVGIGRILSKVHTKKLMRRSSVSASGDSSRNELEYRISGLQN
jgi:hypothetical protein